MFLSYRDLIDQENDISYCSKTALYYKLHISYSSSHQIEVENIKLP